MIGTSLTMRPFALSDRPLFTALSKKYPHFASEPGFPNVLVWDHYPGFAEVEGHLLIQYRREHNEQHRFLPPIGPDPCALMRRLIFEHGFVFDRVGWEFAEVLQNEGRLLVEELDGDADYCYSPLELRSCFDGPNHKFDGLRRRVRAVRKLDPEVRRITPDLLDDCRLVNQWWLDGKGCSQSQDHRDDAQAASMMLDHFLELELFGVLVYFDGAPKAFMLGDVSPAGSAVLHFSKAVNTVKGLSDYAFYVWSTDAIPAGCEVVNFMQDCGAPGLRQFKKSLGPSHYVRKAKISLR